MDAAISLQNVSKCFKLYDRPVDRLKGLLLPSRSRAQDFWALREINITVPPGQTVGLVGQNGSGKSTLLQLIVGTLTPTIGTAQTQGRIAALLELGSGFNPEFTGTQNVFFNGRILGLSQAEIAARFDAIVAFADIGPMLHQPVKTYSSGMVVRLAFAVIINTEPDILIVDEALAVGDIYFQQKCFQRIRELRDRGVTILFVSHDSSSIFKLCDRAILLEKGQMILDDSPKPVLDRYEANMLKRIEPGAAPAAAPTAAPTAAPVIPTATPQPTAPIAIAPPPDRIHADEIVQVQSVKFFDSSDQETTMVISGHPLQVTIGLWFWQAVSDPHVGFKVRNRQGEVIFETNTACMATTIGPIAANSALELRFRINVPLIDGQYTVSVGVAEQALGNGLFRQTLVYAHDLAAITVLRDFQDIMWAGMVNLNPTVQVRRPTSLATS
jgi:lipopolysaccharide transport system ATP-binding protein